MKDIADLLQIKGFGTVGTDILVGQMDDDTNNMIGVYQYAGRTPDKDGIDKPGLQIRVRNTSYAAALSISENISGLLSQIGDEYNETEYAAGYQGTEWYYLRVRPIQSPETLGRDEKEREEFVVNYEVDRRRN